MVEGKCNVSAKVERHYGDTVLLCSECLGVSGQFIGTKIKFAKNKCRITRI
jgi:hypothetical protein